MGESVSGTTSHVSHARFRIRISHFRHPIIQAQELQPHSKPMDQTVIKFDSPPNCSSNIKGIQNVRIATTRAQKRGFTVALCACADGRKLPAMIIFKERNRQLGKSVRASLQYPDNVRVTATTNGWMTKEKLYYGSFSTSGMRLRERGLLVLDHYKPHCCS